METKLERMFENEYVNIGGTLTITAAFLSSIIEWLSGYSFNDYVQGVLTIGGVVFLFYKIKMARIDIKIKERELKSGVKVTLTKKQGDIKQKLFKKTPKDYKK